MQSSSAHISNHQELNRAKEYGYSSFKKTLFIAMPGFNHKVAYYFTLLFSTLLIGCGDNSISTTKSSSVCAEDNFDCIKTVDFEALDKLAEQKTSVPSKKKASKIQRVFNNAAGDILHYQRTVSIKPKKIGYNLIVEVPNEIEVKIVPGTHLDVSYVFVAAEKSQIKLASSKSLHVYQDMFGTNVAPHSQKIVCNKISTTDQVLTELSGICIREIQVTLSKEDEAHILRITPEGKNKELIHTAKWSR